MKTKISVPGILFFIFFILLPLIISIVTTFQGKFAFWYDPARDMLSAWDNITKITLIGPPSGIQGVFYGPYWIWMLSLSQYFSHDPRWAMVVVGIIPYLVVFPFILISQRKLFSFFTLTTLWLLFWSSYGASNATSLWNPNPAALCLLSLILLGNYLRIGKLTKYLLLTSTGFGISLGLLLQFHLSLGLGVLLGTLLFLGLDIFHKIIIEKASLKTIIAHLFCIGLGGFVIFMPTILFELRHHFLQTTSLFHTFFSFGSNIHVQGLSKMDIFLEFPKRLGKLLSIPDGMINLSLLCFCLLPILLFPNYRMSKDTEKYRRLLLLVGLLFGGISLIYFSAHNPVWDYHFISIEILFLFLLGIIAQTNKKVGILLFVIAIIAFGKYLVTSYGVLNSNPYLSEPLAAKEDIVQKIISDAGSNQYTMYSYSPSIYTYDYSYLFRWLGGKDFSYDPGNRTSHPPLVYLIYSPAAPQFIQDFINYRTPPLAFTTTKVWNLPNHVTILKREKKSY